MAISSASFLPHAQPYLYPWLSKVAFIERLICPCGTDTLQLIFVTSAGNAGPALTTVQKSCRTYQPYQTLAMLMFLIEPALMCMACGLQVGAPATSSSRYVIGVGAYVNSRSFLAVHWWYIVVTP